MIMFCTSHFWVDGVLAWGFLCGCDKVVVGLQASWKLSWAGCSGYTEEAGSWCWLLAGTGALRVSFFHLKTSLWPLHMVWPSPCMVAGFQEALSPKWVFLRQNVESEHLEASLRMNTGSFLFYSVGQSNYKAYSDSRGWTNRLQLLRRECQGHFAEGYVT
jgi:hypothetical protein